MKDEPQKNKDRSQRSQPSRVEEGKGTDLLSKICQNPAPRERLQMWDPESLTLKFACGDGKIAVYVSPGGEVELCKTTFKTKFTTDLAQKYIEKPDPINGIQVIHEVQAVLKSYVHFEDERLYYFVATWIVGTYLYSVFGHYGYLFFYSDQPQCGKTMTLEVLSHLAYEATQALNAPTAPAIRDKASSGMTLQLDTLERWRQKSVESHAQAMELLDAGFRNGGTVIKQIPDGDGNWHPEEYPVYTPYAFAGINKRSLSETALDRSFPVEAKRKSTRIRKTRYYSHRCEKQCSPIRDQLYLWALQNASKVARIYESEEFQRKLYALGLNDRAFDIWLPLFSVLKAMGFLEDSEEFKGLVSLAQDKHRSREVDELENKLRVLSLLRSWAEPEGEVSGMSTELRERLKEEGIELSELQFSQRMQEWGFEKKSRRLDSGPRNVWVLPVDHLRELESEVRELLEFVLSPEIGDYTDYTQGKSTNVDE